MFSEHAVLLSSPEYQLLHRQASKLRYSRGIGPVAYAAYTITLPQGQGQDGVKLRGLAMKTLGQLVLSPPLRSPLYARLRVCPLKLCIAVLHSQTQAWVSLFRFV